jgi:hypothetical protein
MRTADNGHLAVVKYLCESSAQIDLANNDGWTTLMRAAEGGYLLEVVKYLCERGAQVGLADNDGSTALMLDPQPEIKKLLKLGGPGELVGEGSEFFPDRASTIQAFMSSPFKMFMEQSILRIKKELHGSISTVLYVRHRFSNTARKDGEIARLPLEAWLIIIGLLPAPYFNSQTGAFHSPYNLNTGMLNPDNAITTRCVANKAISTDIKLQVNYTSSNRPSISVANKDWI